MADPAIRSITALVRELSAPGALKGVRAAAAEGPQEPSPPARADELADLELRDHEGVGVRLGDLWRRRPAALAFLRHYG